MAAQLERGTCARFGPVSPILNDSMYIYSSKLEIGAVYFAQQILNLFSESNRPLRGTLKYFHDSNQKNKNKINSQSSSKRN